MLRIDNNHQLSIIYTCLCKSVFPISFIFILRFLTNNVFYYNILYFVLGSLMDFPPESVELLSLDNRIEMVKY